MLIHPSVPSGQLPKTFSSDGVQQDVSSTHEHHGAIDNSESIQSSGKGQYGGVNEEDSEPPAGVVLEVDVSVPHSRHCLGGEVHGRQEAEVLVAGVKGDADVVQDENGQDGDEALVDVPRDPGVSTAVKGLHDGVLNFTADVLSKYTGYMVVRRVRYGFGKVPIGRMKMIPKSM